MGVSKGVKFLKQIFWVVVSSILASYDMIKVGFQISRKNDMFTPNLGEMVQSDLQKFFKWVEQNHQLVYVVELVVGLWAISWRKKLAQKISTRKNICWFDPNLSGYLVQESGLIKGTWWSIYMTSLGERNKDGLSSSPKISRRWLPSWRFFLQMGRINHQRDWWFYIYCLPGLRSGCHPDTQKRGWWWWSSPKKTGLKYLELFIHIDTQNEASFLKPQRHLPKKPGILLVSVGSNWSRGCEFKKKIKPTWLEATVQWSPWRDQLYLKWKLIFHPPSLLALQHVHFPRCPCVCLLDDVLRIRSWD